MTVVFGQHEFAASRREDAERASAQRRIRRAEALRSLHDARFAACATTEGDSDRIEAIAARLVAFVDALEPEFDRLDRARDIEAAAGFEGRRIRRSLWDRPGLALVLAEGFQEVLDGPAFAVLAAATRLETCA